MAGNAAYSCQPIFCRQHVSHLATIMRLIHIGPTDAGSPVSRGVWLFIAFVILGGSLSKPAVAQSHNVDGSFLVEARINGDSAVLLIDTGAERSSLDREFAQRLGLPS